MKHKHTSFAFLMEMLWVCGFFIISSCIFVLAFVKADRLSLKAQNLNQAVVSVQNAVEDTFYRYETGNGKDGSQSYYFDQNWQPLNDEKQAVFCISIDSATKDGLLDISAEASGADGESIYSLDGARYLSD